MPRSALVHVAPATIDAREQFTLALPHRADEHPALVYLARLAPGSRRTMEGALNTLAQMLGVPQLVDQDGKDRTCLQCDWAALRYQHTHALRALLAQQYRATTANKILSALRGVLKEAWRLGYLPTDDYQRAVDVENIAGLSMPRGRYVQQDERAAMLAACATNDTLADRRDVAILAVMQGTGVRRSEVVAFDLRDYRRQDTVLHVRAGKGNKDRVVHLSQSAVPALEDWLEVRGAWRGPLFCRILKGNKLTQHRLSDQAIYRIVNRRAKEAGVEEALTPHDFRRTFISDVLDAGADLSIGSALAGHADPRTTKRYDLRDAAAKKRAADQVEVKYVPRGRK